VCRSVVDDFFVDGPADTLPPPPWICSSTVRRVDGLANILDDHIAESAGRPVSGSTRTRATCTPVRGAGWVMADSPCPAPAHVSPRTKRSGDRCRAGLDLAWHAFDPHFAVISRGLDDASSSLTVLGPHTSICAAGRPVPRESSCDSISTRSLDAVLLVRSRERAPATRIVAASS